MSIKLNIHDAKTHLSHYLSYLTSGQKIVLCKRNIPIAEIHALPSKRKKKRPIGLEKGKIKLLKSFLDPLPEEIERAFWGE